MKSLRQLLKAILAVLAAAMAAAPSPLLACAACTGQTDSSLAVGMNWGIVTLLVFVLTVLSCFAVFFVHLARRSPTENDDVNPPRPVE